MSNWLICINNNVTVSFIYNNILIIHNMNKNKIHDNMIFN